MNEKVTIQLSNIDKKDIVQEPFRNLARLATVRNTGSKHGSGVFINGRFILTAAHNVADITAFGIGSKIRQATISLGYRDEQESVWISALLNRGSSNWPNGYRPQWQKFGKFPFSKDYAVMDLGEYLPEYSSSFRLPSAGEVKELLIEGHFLHLAGFPGETYSGKQLMTGMTNEVQIDQNSKFIRYPNLKTYTGNSGGPVWVEHNNENILAGVHVTGSSAILLDGKALRDVLRWMQGVQI